MTFVPSAVSIDFETASTLDLRKTGAHEYARHPDTRILCLSYAFEGAKVKRWKPGEPFPQELADHVARRRHVHGWNVGFELVIWNYVLLRQHPELCPLEVGQLRDTMARAAYWGLPLSLDEAAKAVGLPPEFWKDKDGHRLMMQMNKPRRTKSGLSWWHEEDPAKLDRLQDYCDQDVVTEASVGALIPALPEEEQALWELDQKINERGVQVDLDMVDTLKGMASRAGADTNSYVEQLTNGAVKTITSTAALQTYLTSIGSPIANLKKDTVQQRLDDPSTPDHEREILELRLDGAKTSTAKLNAMIEASRHDGRARGALQFYGASRTGRWAGRLIQLQNMPRGTVKLIEQALEAIANGMSDDLLEAFFGPLLGIVSSALRGCIVAKPGNKLVVADFAQIEARVVAWLAGQSDILDTFRAYDAGTGPDVYTYTARQNGSSNRQLGKVLVLACGFGMSWRKFKDTAKTYGLALTDEFAEQAVKTWRANNRMIVQFWWDCDAAAKAVLQSAINGASASYNVGPVSFAMWRGHLLIKLPSGRKLVYRDARLETDELGRVGITYMGVDQYTRKWKRQRTYGGKLVENITQAVARDIMALATQRAEHLGLRPELLVHDEMICEAPAATADTSLKHLLRAMKLPPVWAKGLPVDAAGWAGDRYKK
ncbi:MAG: hypothetical protein J0I48_19150 [Devosia sp.]|uniref:DNA polymerase n=1 Tax=Devosia sp. 66-22 TaxID=1895753 RepID=UPI0009268D29|nr:DNA polymerase [Devosia sp. 66-22]MBN9348284.1 hypothetical protein [Devosia sp.]OJX48975.1 MAG: hypothetical protein BGO81_10295 [Devosia sp. 66-22]